MWYNSSPQVLLSVFSVSPRWEQVVDIENALYLGAKPRVAEQDEAATQKLRWEELKTWQEQKLSKPLAS